MELTVSAWVVIEI